MRVPVIAALCLMALPAAAQDMPAVFKKCQPCHAIGADAANKVGPQLNGVVGLPVGGVGGYSYSPAMQAARASGLEWTRETLTQFLKRPKHLIPGTSMAFAGMTQRAEIDAIIDYLATFDATGARVTP